MFGYKNLYEPKQIQPGPGDYDIGGALIQKKPFKPTQVENRKKQTPLKILNNHQECYNEYFSDSSQNISNSKYFSTSNRSQCLILPQLSKGPQYYNITQSNNRNSISFEGYSSRNDSINNRSLSLQRICNRELRKNKREVCGKFILKPQLSEKKFRDYSYLQKDKYGPTFCDFPKEKAKCFHFNILPRFEQNKNQMANDSISDITTFIQKTKDNNNSNSSPKYTFPKQNSDKISYYSKIKKIVQISPGPGKYNINFNQGISISFSKNQRFKMIYY